MIKVGQSGTVTEAKPISLGIGAIDGDWTAVSEANTLPVGQIGTGYIDISVASLSAGQAAGTATVCAAKANRRALMINPPADCTLAIAASATRGWPLFANVPNVITGQECPANALYVVGLAAAAALTIWEG